MNNCHMDPEDFDPTTYRCDRYPVRRERVTISPAPGLRVVADRPHVELRDQRMSRLLMRLWRQQTVRTVIRCAWYAAIAVLGLALFAWVAE